MLAVELGQRARELLLPCRMSRRFELAAQFRVRQPQRLGASEFFRVVLGLTACPPRALFLALVHPFLNAILCVDQSFTSICH